MDNLRKVLEENGINGEKVDKIINEYSIAQLSDAQENSQATLAVDNEPRAQTNAASPSVRCSALLAPYFVFLCINLVANLLIPGLTMILWGISPILGISYLLLLAVSLYQLKSLWLCLWCNLRNGQYRRQFDLYWNR